MYIHANSVHFYVGISRAGFLTASSLSSNDHSFILSEVGYLVEADPADTPGALSVRAGRVSTPATLAEDIRRMLADLRGAADSSEESGLSP